MCEYFLSITEAGLCSKQSGLFSSRRRGLPSRSYWEQLVFAEVSKRDCFVQLCMCFGDPQVQYSSCRVLCKCLRWIHEVFVEPPDHIFHRCLYFWKRRVEVVKLSVQISDHYREYWRISRHLPHTNFCDRYSVSKYLPRELAAQISRPWMNKRVI